MVARAYHIRDILASRNRLIEFFVVLEDADKRNLYYHYYYYSLSHDERMKIISSSKEETNCIVQTSYRVFDSIA